MRNWRCEIQNSKCKIQNDCVACGDDLVGGGAFDAPGVLAVYGPSWAPAPTISIICVSKYNHFALGLRPMNAHSSPSPIDNWPVSPYNGKDIVQKLRKEEYASDAIQRTRVAENGYG